MKFLVSITALLFTTLALGGVNLKNGNFYVAYTDIVVPGGGHDLKIVRTYNSKAIEKGWFGVGWGSDYETYLVVSADGSVVIHENGSGALTRFTPKDPVDARSASKKIIEAMRKKSTMSDSVAKKLEDQLANAAELRQMYARKFGVKAEIASGTVLYSNVRGLQKLHKLKDGFRRDYTDGKSEFFNKNGKLNKVSDKNGYKLELNYKDDTLISMKDNQAKQLFFEWFPDGKVKSIWGSDKKKTVYTYNGDDLASSVNVKGQIFGYRYDGNHNMTKIKYTDGTNMEVEYNKKTQFVSSVTTRKGEQTKYKYEANPKNSEMHYWTIVSKKNAADKWVNNRYEYETKNKPDGSQYTYRILTEVNGLKTETIYSECCSLPLKIARGKHVTTFEYNDRGLLSKKTSTKGDFVQLEYHKKLDKITRVVNGKGWTNFDYDKKGNLSKAVNSVGKQVLLLYDRKGRITKMIDKKKTENKSRVLTFEYNALGKPVEIAMQGTGKINVAYDNYGEIKKVDSKAGHKMALQVTQAFQSLLSIVKPAGVNLNL